jgi:hypothetical protein
MIKLNISKFATERTWLFLLIVWLPLIILIIEGLVGFIYLMFLLCGSAYYAVVVLNQKRYFSFAQFLFSAVFALWVAFTPYTHISIPMYIEKDGQKILNKHSHSLWENGHIH